MIGFDCILSVRGLSASFGKKIILSDINFDLPVTGVTVLMGPCGTGKSTLLRSLSGLNQSSASCELNGEVFFCGEALGKNGFPVMMTQKPSMLSDTVFEYIAKNLPERENLSKNQVAAFLLRYAKSYGVDELLKDKFQISVSELSLLERRAVFVLSAIVTAPPLVFFDEPTTDLSDEEAEMILKMIAKVSLFRSVLVVLHNQQHAKFFSGGKLILIAGGVVHESAELDVFFETPISQAGKDFVRTGSCAVPSPDADPSSLDPEFVEKYLPKIEIAPQQERITPFGPSGFKWVIRNQLAATPRPGLLENVDFDLEALSKVKINVLVSLEESITVPVDLAARYGIEVLWLSIIDMGVPQHDALEALLSTMHSKINAGKKVAVHCKAGLGRTGTVITAYLIKMGNDYTQALQQVRCVDPRMVQSEEQELFLMDFANKYNNKIIHH